MNTFSDKCRVGEAINPAPPQAPEVIPLETLQPAIPEPMNVKRVHFFKTSSNFVEFDPVIPNKVKSTTLPQDLLEPGDYVLAVRQRDIRGLNSTKIEELLAKIEYETPTPIYFWVLKSTSNPLYLRKDFKVSIFGTTS